MDAFTNTCPSRDTKAEGARMNALVGVMGKLKAIMEEENSLLHRGLPATLLVTTREKGELSNSYASLGAELTVGRPHAGEVIADPALQSMLVEAGAALRALSEENRALLAGALAATRRRVDAVMAAVRTRDPVTSERWGGEVGAPVREPV